MERKQDHPSADGDADPTPLVDKVFARISQVDQFLGSGVLYYGQALSPVLIETTKNLVNGFGEVLIRTKQGILFSMKEQKGTAKDDSTSEE